MPVRPNRSKVRWTGIGPLKQRFDKLWKRDETSWRPQESFWTRYRHALLAIALLVIVANSGCTGTWSHLFDTHSVTAPVNPSVNQPLPKGPITEWEPANAHRLADAVWDEMARDEQKEVAAPGKDAKKR